MPDPKHKDISIRIPYRCYQQLLRLVKTGYFGAGHTAAAGIIVQNAVRQMVVSGELGTLLQSAKDVVYEGEKFEPEGDETDEETG